MGADSLGALGAGGVPDEVGGGGGGGLLGGVPPPDGVGGATAAPFLTGGGVPSETQLSRCRQVGTNDSIHSGIL